MTSRAAKTTAALPVVPDQIPVLPRRDGSIRLGFDPADALVVPLDAAANPVAVAKLLIDLRTPLSAAQLRKRLRAAGLTSQAFRNLLDRLVDAGKATTRTAQEPNLRVRVHGDGPIADSLLVSLASAGLLIGASGPESLHAGLADCNLLVLADRPVHDPAVRLALMTSRTPHLEVVVRDGIGVIGPLVLPGLTSCLRCADLHRCALEPEWPSLAMLLAAAAGDADPSTVAATAALAHREIIEINAALTHRSTATPQSVNHRLQVNASHTGTTLVSAPPHPGCDCGGRHAPSMCSPSPRQRP